MLPVVFIVCCTKGILAFEIETVKAQVALEVCGGYVGKYH
jgi:hypothetical protein